MKRTLKQIRQEAAHYGVGCFKQGDQWIAFSRGENCIYENPLHYCLNRKTEKYILEGLIIEARQRRASELVESK